MKITYKTNVLDIIRLVENNTPALWEKEQNNFPNTWGGVNSLTKQVVKDLLVMINLPYSKELAGFIRYIVECPNTIRYSEYKRSLIDNCVFRIVRELCSEDCLICWYRNCNIYMFCNELPINLYLKPI